MCYLFTITCLPICKNGSLYAVHLAKVSGMTNKDKDDNNDNYDNTKKLSCNDSLRRANIMRPLSLGYTLKSPLPCYDRHYSRFKNQ